MIKIWILVFYRFCLFINIGYILDGILFFGSIGEEVEFYFFLDFVYDLYKYIKV